MEPFSMVALGMGALNAGLSIFAGNDRAKQLRRETAEQVRRFTMQGERKISSAEALGLASGVEAGSESLTKYLSDMSLEFRKQVDWMKSAGEAGAKASEMQGLFQGIGDLGGSLFSFGASNNWFRTPTK